MLKQILYSVQYSYWPCISIYTPIYIYIKEYIIMLYWFSLNIYNIYIYTKALI